MKITLNTQELNQAVVEYLSNQGLTIDTNKVSINIDEEGVTIDTAANTNASAKPKKEKKAEPVKPVAETSTEDTTEVVTEAPVSSSDAEEVVDEPVVATKDTRSLFGSSEHTDDVLEDDTPQIPKENSVEKTRKLFS